MVLQSGFCFVACYNDRAGLLPSSGLQTYHISTTILYKCGRSNYGGIAAQLCGLDVSDCQPCMIA